MYKLHIKKGDMVYVNAGDNRGAQGKVLSVDAAKQRAVVEGVNICKKATKPNAQNPQGGIIEKEAPIHVSNVAIFNPETSKADRVGFKVEDGKKVRIFKSTQKTVDA